jgi:hypothetical protein
MNALMSQIEILSWVKTSICGPLGAKDQKPTSQNKVLPVMHLGLQDVSDREGERERKVRVSLKEQASFCRAFASVGGRFL